jgi:hypothetical protein
MPCFDVASISARPWDQKVYESRFGGYHVLGNNCEHFCTWARYGFQQSDQVGFGLTAAVAGLGLLLGGPPGAMMGGMLGRAFTTHLSASIIMVDGVGHIYAALSILTPPLHYSPF